jgi:glycosyltransferase involved in cell wall biosynthesis
LTKLGYVVGPHEFYSKINVALSPVRFGAGLKIKVLEALASGCPVVATSHSVEGFPAGIREVASVEDNYDNWTKDLLKESLSIPKSTIENYITNYFSIDVAETTLKEFV